ncbi:hypothetical protein FKG94_16000 [Exilibacterium tricleocarpae]|uniref:Uncharacterized protein n=1 Tax=Exilibacterium tricleocarpae TaxID=2591008 RepID=A0A545TBC3_9GAMM|nr:hypothetical protein [Exilibacterium tricleocarpae]TQV74517.1 hypothetical protein FKG94_16000 [Exilibacterium tricleocarpae]
MRDLYSLDSLAALLQASAVTGAVIEPRASLTGPVAARFSSPRATAARVGAVSKPVFRKCPDRRLSPDYLQVTPWITPWHARATPAK